MVYTTLHLNIRWLTYDSILHVYMYNYDHLFIFLLVRNHLFPSTRATCASRRRNAMLRHVAPCRPWLRCCGGLALAAAKTHRLLLFWADGQIEKKEGAGRIEIGSTCLIYVWLKKWHNHGILMGIFRYCWYKVANRRASHPGDGTRVMYSSVSVGVVHALCACVQAQSTVWRFCHTAACNHLTAHLFAAFLCLFFLLLLLGGGGGGPSARSVVSASWGEVGPACDYVGTSSTRLGPS